MGTLVLRAPQTRRATIAMVAGFAVLMSVAAQIAVPIPGTPVPITLGPLVVVLAGLWLGPVAGAASMILYLAAGAAGLPVFAPIGAPGILRFAGPTGGYLIAYPAVAAVTGYLAQKRGDFAGRSLAAFVGLIVLFAGGISHLAIYTGSVATAFKLGLTPFAGLDVVKALIAAALAPKRESRAGA